jgi:S-formylglutathione hydrolase FrmB
MARLSVDFFSDVLELDVAMTVILPQTTSTKIGLPGGARDSEPPVLYLLHGLSDDHTIWTRMTSVERYVEPLGLAVVMPQIHRSFYADEVHGHRYWTFLSEELPEVAGSFFRLSSRREDTFVAGLSMGGYGAFRWALRQPDRFAAAASLSGALDLVSLRRTRGRRAVDPDLFDRVFGDHLEGTDSDLFWLLDRADPATLPRLYLGCGTEDELYPQSVNVRDACTARRIPLTVDFGPGDHDWAYWDARIPHVLSWLPLARTSS